MYKIIYVVLCFISLALFSSSSNAMTTCNIAANDINFGVINPLSGGSVAGNSTITISCFGANAFLIFYRLELSQGSAPSYSPREMQRMGGGGTIDYNLFTNAGHTNIWGDGSGGTSRVTRLFQDCPIANPCTETIYGLLPLPQPAVIPGTYSDQITVNMDYIF